MEEQVNEDVFALGDLERIGEALEIIGFNSDDFKQSDRMEMLSKVASYLNKHPDPTYFTRKAVGSKQIDRLPFMFEYVGLHEKLDKIKQQERQITQEIEHYER